MKRIGLFIFFISSFIFSRSQEAQVGLKAGMNISNIANNQSGNLSSRVGLHIGGLAHIHLTPEWAIQPEVVYSSQGGKYTDNNGDVHQVVLNYFNIPL